MTKNNILTSLSLVVIILFLFFVFFLDKKNTSSCLNKYPYLSEDLNCDEDPSSQTSSLKESVQELVDREVNNKGAEVISVFYRDLANRQWFGINENEYFSPNSLLKLPLAISFYKIAEVNQNVLLQKRKYQKTSLDELDSEQNIKPTVLLNEGEYTIGELLDYMMKTSDNDSKVILSESLNKEFVDKVSVDLGLRVPRIGDVSQDIVSVKIYGSIFRSLFNASYLNQEYSNKLLQSMIDSEFKEGIVAGVPSGTKVSNKFGERKLIKSRDQNKETIELHDCGVLYVPEGPYVLCVMVQGQDYSTLIGIISEISKTIYENR